MNNEILNSLKYEYDYKKEILNLSENINKSVKSYYEAQNAIHNSLTVHKIDLQKVNKLKEQTAKLEREILKIKEEAAKASRELTDSERQTVAWLEKEAEIAKTQEQFYENKAKYDKDRIAILKQSVSLHKSLGNTIKKEIVEQVKEGWKRFLDYDSAVRKSALSMGILSTQSYGFSQNMYQASVRTQILGASAKDLANYQRGYSEQLGRSVTLSVSGYEAMAEMANGTVLGAEGATEMASEMDRFGVSVTRSRDLVQDVVNTAQKMGTNAGVAAKEMNKVIKLSTKFSLKNGINDIKEMANLAAKFKLSMESIAGFADKLFTPEGAIDAAAQLQVLGGEWAKLADPFKLMYDARHDMLGLQKSIIEATKGVANFNSETQQFEISGMEMHRLREIAKATGMQYEDLANSALEVAKTSAIKAKISASIDPKYHDFITSVSTFGKNGEIKLNLFNQDGSITKLTDLNDTVLEGLVKQNESLKKRAEEAQSLDQLWGNLKDTFKATLLPAMKGFEMGIREPLNKFIKWMGDNDIAGKVAKLTTTLGNWLSNPIIAGVATLGAIMFSPAKWYLNGKMLAMGFNSSISKKGGMFSKEGFYSKTTGEFMGTDEGFKENPNAEYNKGGVFRNASKRARNIGIATSVLGTGIDLANQMQNEPSQGLNVASKALEFGGLGASVGSLFPGVGTLVGGAAGALGGATYAMMNPVNKTETEVSMQPMATKQNDFVMRPGQQAQPFNSNDTLIGFKPDGPIMKNAGKASETPSNIKMSFEPIKIEFGPIKIEMGGTTTQFNLDKDPILMRELSSAIQKELRKSIGGGVLNPNPLK